MTCSIKPNYVETTLEELSPTIAWGVASGMGMQGFNDAFVELSSPTETVVPTIVDEEGVVQNSAVQIRHGYNLVELIENAHPNFFGDCFTEADKRAKLAARILSIRFDYSATADGESLVRNNNDMYNHSGRFVANTPSVQAIEDFNQYPDSFVADNGFLYLDAVSKYDETVTELSSMALTSKLKITFLFDPNYDTRKRTFRLGGEKQPYYLFVKAINRDIMAPIENNLVAVNQGKFLYNYGSSNGVRHITLDCIVRADSEEELPRLMEDFAQWIDKGETTLQFADTPERIWHVILDGSTSYTSENHVGRVSLDYVCREVTSEGELIVIEQEVTDPTETIIINNTGTAESYPTMRLKFAEDTPFMDIVSTQESANVSLGDRLQVIVPPTPAFDPTPLVHSSAFQIGAAAGWRHAPDDMLPSSIEEFPTEKTFHMAWGGLAYPAAWRYNKPTQENAWSQNAIVTNLPRGVDNFHAELTIWAMGKLSTTMTNFCGIIFYDAENKIIARSGFGIRFSFNTYESWVSDNVTTGHETYIARNRGTTAWNNFRGKLIVERRDNKWRTVVGQFKDRRDDPVPVNMYNYGDSVLKDTKWSQWQTLPSETWNRPVARIGVYFNNFGGRTPINHFSARVLRMWENLEKPEEDIRQIQSFKKDDELVVDFKKAQVWKNGTLSPSTVQPSTDWFSLRKGINAIGLNNFKGKAEIIYNNRYL